MRPRERVLWSVSSRRSTGRGDCWAVYAMPRAAIGHPRMPLTSLRINSVVSASARDQTPRSRSRLDASVCGEGLRRPERTRRGSGSMHPETLLQDEVGSRVGGVRTSGVRSMQTDACIAEGRMSTRQAYELRESGADIS
jgi:hypothetical protein